MLSRVPRYVAARLAVDVPLQDISMFVSNHLLWTLVEVQFDCQGQMILRNGMTID